MSSRALRRLQADKKQPPEDAAASDPETDVTAGGARRKRPDVNRYDLLDEQSHSESEVKEDDGETEAADAPDAGEGRDAAARRKKRKRKRKSAGAAGKANDARRSSEDNAEVDEAEPLVNTTQATETPATCSTTKTVNVKSPGTLSIQHRHLNPNNELKRIFGSKIVQSEHNKRRNRGGRGHLRASWLTTAKDNWPTVGKLGLSMSLDTKSGMFRYEHAASYQHTQRQFLEAVESMHPDNIVSIINGHPYHVDALIQLSDLCKLSEDLAMAAELVERALYCLEHAFHSLFNMAQGNCRLDYRRQENRALFVTLFKHLAFVGGRACYRTALELCKVLLSLDPDSDPLAIVLAMDFYALRAREHAWLVDFAAEWESHRNLSQLPNFAFSLAVAHYQLAGSGSDRDLTVADNLLQKALIMFPGVLRLLLEKCSVQADAEVASHKYFEPDAAGKQSAALTTLITLYVHRTYHVWKEPELMAWLERNVHVVMGRVDSGDPFIKECEIKRKIRYQRTPRNVLRHVLLSDMKEVTAPLARDMQEPVLSFDPLPPADSINLYVQTKTPPKLPQNTNTLAVFFRSLHPNFNVVHNREQDMPEINLEDEARGGPQADDSNTMNLRRSVVYLVDAMRDLLNNVRLPDVPNEADVDENDDSDDEQNNYLT